MRKKANELYFDKILKRGRLLLLLTLLGIASSILLLFMHVPNEYKMLYLLPIVYVLFLLFFIRKEFILGMGSRTLIIMYFIKMCIIPITETIGAFSHPLADSIKITYWNEACMYICLEWLLISFSILTLGKKYLKKFIGRKKTDYTLNKMDNSILYIFTYTLTIFCIGMLITNHGFLNEFFWVWGQDLTGLIANEGGSLYYLFKTLLEIVKPFLFFIIVITISNSSLGKSKNVFILIIAVIASVLLTEYRLLSIVSGMTIIVFLVAKGNSNLLTRTAKIIFGVIFICSIWFMTTQGIQVNKTLSNLCRLFDNYCGGVIVASGACSVKLENGLEMFFNDVKAGSYVIRHFSEHIITTTELINASVNIQARGIFYEMMIQCRDFFGLFSPIAIGLVVKFVLYCDYSSENETMGIYKLMYIFMGINVGAMIVMYTFSMTVNFILYKCLIWLTVIQANKHFKLIIRRS